MAAIFVTETVVTKDYPGDVPHRLAGQTLLNSQPVRRRVEVRFRQSGEYVASCLSNEDGTFAFRHLPPQTLATPYVVTCFDDSNENPNNVLAFDRVYQVDDNGLPPQT